MTWSLSMASCRFDDDDDDYDRTVFLSATVNSESRSWQILAQFLENFDYEKGSWFIQHDGATDLVARNSVTTLRNFYVNRIITSSFVVCPFTRCDVTWVILWVISALSGRFEWIEFMYLTYNGAENLFCDVFKIRWVLLNRTLDKAMNHKFVIPSIFICMQYMWASIIQIENQHRTLFIGRHP